MRRGGEFHGSASPTRSDALEFQRCERRPRFCDRNAPRSGHVRRLLRMVPLVDQHPPRTKAHETLTAAEVAALRAAADAAGGWRALARAWPEVSAATLARLASGSLATPIVLFVARVRLAQHSVPPSRPGTMRALPAAPAARKVIAG